MPDLKIISNFRNDISEVIRGVSRPFVVLCLQLGLFEEDLLATNGSKFKTVNNRNRNFTGPKLQRRMEEIEPGINRYLSALDEADRQEPSTAQAKIARVEEKNRQAERSCSAGEALIWRLSSVET